MIRFLPVLADEDLPFWRALSQRHRAWRRRYRFQIGRAEPGSNLWLHDHLHALLGVGASFEEEEIVSFYEYNLVEVADLFDVATEFSLVAFGPRCADDRCPGGCGFDHPDWEIRVQAPGTICLQPLPLGGQRGR